MEQILQNLKTGATTIVKAPSPSPAPGKLLIATARSLISAGTERMLLDFGKAGLIDKARQQPEKVRMVLDKVKTDGLLTTFDTVQAKLSQPLPLGYCNAGVVVGIGRGVEGFALGDRVASNGPHADLVHVPRNLCAKIPDSVDLESAAFTVLAAIGLQGIRLAQPTLGEAVVVTGVGLIGLATVQLLRAQGCRVLAIDYDERKLQIAAEFGAITCNPGKGEDPVAAGMAFSRGNGVDAVIITASTASNDPVSQAARMSRKRGRIILVGVTGLELNRSEFYNKELSFQVSCSYGPGRYDPRYEQEGHDYPLGSVRWTEQRNLEAVLDLMSSGALRVKPLITHRYIFSDAPNAYETLITDRSALGILLEYPDRAPPATSARTVELKPRLASQISAKSRPVCAFIGAGNYASRVLIPAFNAAKAELRMIVSSSGITGVIHGEAGGFQAASTDVDAVMNDASINTVAIVTRHDSHARYVVQALKAGKNVFVEKPLAMTPKDLKEVEAAYQEAIGQGRQPRLMVGFNRRFSPHVQKMKSLLGPVKEAKAMIMTVNAGAIPADHWTQHPETGGGRIIGEACHFIDLMRFLANSPVVSIQARRMGSAPEMPITEDKATITLGFADGSFGTIHYLANGASGFPKERLEIFAAGRILQLDNFRAMIGYKWPGFSKSKLWRQDKGQAACVEAFLKSIEEGKPSPIPIEEVFEVARVTLDAAEQLRKQL